MRLWRSLLFVPANQRRMLTDIEAFDADVARGIAITTVDGKLVDVAMAKTARNILELVATIAGRNP